MNHNNNIFCISSFFSISIGLLFCMSICVNCSAQPNMEICDNAIDDDGDGLIDLNDPDCDCLVVEQESLIPNHSFEDLECCPDEMGQLRCLNTWIQASEPTTDFLHECGYLGWDEFPPPRPFPDGQGILGFRDGVYNDGMVNPMNVGPYPAWKEYAGACLNFPMVADSAYRIQFSVGFVNDALSPPINMTIFGATDCANLPFGVDDPAFGCPANGPDWVELGAIRVTGMDQNIWVEAGIDIKHSEDIVAIAIGPECIDHPREVSVYYFLDDLFLADDETFDLRISESDHVCSEKFTLSVPANSSFTFQWYKNGIALLGETNHELSMMHGEGIYQLRALEDLSCRLSKEYLFKKEFTEELISESICENDIFQFGDMSLTSSGRYRDTLKNVNNCDSILILDLNVFGEFADTIEVKIFEGETYSIAGQNISEIGAHLLSVASSKGCDSLLVLKLEHHHVYIPNVFSPNNDGINDQFTVYGQSGQIANVDIKIFTRWGNLIHQGANWDGRLNTDKMADPGVFVYVADVEMSDGASRQFEGSLTILK